MMKALWTNKLSHGDLISENIMFDKKSKKWVLIDLDMIKMHKTKQAAMQRDLGMLDPVLKDMLKPNSRCTDKVTFRGGKDLVGVTKKLSRTM
jgi:tRNA A-37 threonylcarbamoyl transferase component Bud32